MLVLLLFITVSATKAQLSRTDSLRKLITFEKDHQKRIHMLLALANEFRTINPDSSYSIAQQLAYFADNDRNKDLKLKAELNAVYYYMMKNKVDSGLLLSEKNISALNKMNGTDSLLAQYYSAAGLNLMRLNRQKDAMEHFFEALKKSEKADDKLMMVKAQHNIGWAYMELNRFTEAITHFKQAIQTSQEQKLVSKIPVTFNNIASCYGSLNQYDSVFKYGGRGVEIAHSTNNYQAEANGWFILGTAYTNQKKYREALDCYLKAKPIREKIGDTFYIVSDMAVLAELYAMMNNTSEGLKIGKEALRIANKNNLQAKLPMIYKAIAMNYEQNGDYAAAANMYKQMNLLKDTLYENASTQSLAEMQTKYETEKKERIIQQQQFNLRQKNYLIAAVTVLTLIGAFIVWLFYNRNKLKQEAKLQAAIHQQQQMASAAVLEAEEKERQRIAKDLHDGVGQMMSAAKMNLSAFENELTFANTEQQHAFERIIELVDESCKEVRTVSHQMMPNVLIKSGLAKAVAEFLDKIDQRVIKVNLHTEGLNERIDENTEIVLYRVMQESVNNVIKHSGAARLDIALIKDEAGIRATIEDNGKGFDTDAPGETAGIGLKNMRARIEYLQGTIDIDSSPGNGTLVAIHVPVKKAEI